jgi:hypothetical protein
MRAVKLAASISSARAMNGLCCVFSRVCAYSQEREASPTWRRAPSLARP